MSVRYAIVLKRVWEVFPKLKYRGRQEAVLPSDGLGNVGGHWNRPIGRGPTNEIDISNHLMIAWACPDDRQGVSEGASSIFLKFDNPAGGDISGWQQRLHLLGIARTATKGLLLSKIIIKITALFVNNWIFMIFEFKKWHEWRCNYFM